MRPWLQSYVLLSKTLLRKGLTLSPCSSHYCLQSRPGPFPRGYLCSGTYSSPVSSFRVWLRALAQHALPDVTPLTRHLAPQAAEGH